MSSPLQLQRFRVHLGDPNQPTPEATHDLVILPADRMRAERLSTQLLAPSQRGKDARGENAETWLMLWLWCAATRVQLTADPFDDFAGRVLDYDRLKLTADGELVLAKRDDDQDEDDDEDDEDPELGPTRPTAPTPSP